MKQVRESTLPKRKGKYTFILSTHMAIVDFSLMWMMTFQHNRVLHVLGDERKSEVHFTPMVHSYFAPIVRNH